MILASDWSGWTDKRFDWLVGGGVSVSRHKVEIELQCRRDPQRDRVKRSLLIALVNRNGGKESGCKT